MNKSVQINMKASPAVRNLLDRAAQLSHKNRTEFVLDSAIQHAEEVISSNQYIQVDEEAFKQFVQALDEPPAGNPRLKRLLQRKAPWE